MLRMYKTGLQLHILNSSIHPSNREKDINTFLYFYPNLVLSFHFFDFQGSKYLFQISSFHLSTPPCSSSLTRSASSRRLLPNCAWRGLTCRSIWRRQLERQEDPELVLLGARGLSWAEPGGQVGTEWGPAAHPRPQWMSSELRQALAH